MSQDPDVNYEPLPGYRLIERLGSGGYGEVWRAEAPGGLMKAIKFVFGKHDEKRASIELRALDHVRSVRHPFLLSLERIEVVDGRLLVVTELADESIKDRFEVCRREGLRGIPRDELIRYLRDTADALDFMGETHALLVLGGVTRFDRRIRWRARSRHSYHHGSVRQDQRRTRGLSP